jgi:iron complex transport system substrate-binding protein
VFYGKAVRGAGKSEDLPGRAGYLPRRQAGFLTKLRSRTLQGVRKRACAKKSPKGAFGCTETFSSMIKKICYFAPSERVLEEKFGRRVSRQDLEDENGISPDRGSYRSGFFLGKCQGTEQKKSFAGNGCFKQKAGMYVTERKLYRKIGRTGTAVAAILLMFGASPCFGKIFHDALGRTVMLPASPQRIVSLAPNITEILFYLGLGNRVVGVTRYSYYPPEAMKKPKVGSYIRVNAEKIIALKPDLVLGTMDGNSSNSVQLLEQAGIPVYVVNPRTVEETIATIARLGALAGMGEKGEQTAETLTSRVNRIIRETAGLERPRVFLQINIRPIMTVNSRTIHNDVIRLAGGKNITAGLAVTYPRVSREEVIAEKPDVIIISSMAREGRFEKARQEWLRWPSIPAVKNRKVFLIDSDLIDRPSPRIIDGLEIMAGLLHAEVTRNRGRNAENNDSSR